MAHAATPTAIKRTKIIAAINMARRSPGVSGLVGGVLPALTVGGSFVRRTRSINNRSRVLLARLARRERFENVATSLSEGAHNMGMTCVMSSEWKRQCG